MKVILFQLVSFVFFDIYSYFFYGITIIVLVTLEKV
jgi:hypothetical protein